jgi:hypothetical protein
MMFIQNCSADDWEKKTDVLVENLILVTFSLPQIPHEPLGLKWGILVCDLASGGALV